MNRSSRLLKLLSFLLSENFIDAFRITLSIVLPVVIAFLLDYPHEAIYVGLGSLMISLTDTAGSMEQKRNMSLISLPLFFVISLTVSATWPYTLAVGILLSVIVFFGSMLAVLGARFYLLGSACTVLAIFVMGFKPQQPLNFSLLLILGAASYYALSLLHSKLFPLKSARQSVAECISATGDFLHFKALFYRLNVPLAQAERQLLSEHLKVNDKQQQIRAIVLKEPRAMHQQDQRGKSLLKISVLIIDLYDEISAVHYDYEKLRNTFRVSGVLELVCGIIELMSHELYRISYAVNSGAKINALNNYTEEMQLVKERLIYIIERESMENAKVLQTLALNISGISEKIEKIRTVLIGREGDYEKDVDIQYEYFVNDGSNPFSALSRHFNSESGVFRFAARLTVACLAGFIVNLFHPLGTYSYWVILTIVIIMRPTFQQTVKRNKQRLAGSLIGIAAGFGAVYLIPYAGLQLATAIICLWLFFALNRLNYKVSVIFVTVMVILCLNIYSGSEMHVILERLIDTLVGCGIAFAASYVFPVWESGKVSFFMAAVLKANISYLEKLIAELAGSPDHITTYKLSRKDAYVNLANLAVAVNGMMAEPHRLSMHEKNVFRFQVLNQMLTSVISSSFTISRNGETSTVVPPESPVLVEAVASLQRSLNTLTTGLTTSVDVSANNDNILQICTDIEEQCRHLAKA